MYICVSFTLLKVFGNLMQTSYRTFCMTEVLLNCRLSRARTLNSYLHRRFKWFIMRSDGGIFIFLTLFLSNITSHGGLSNQIAINLDCLLLAFSFSVLPSYFKPIPFSETSSPLSLLPSLSVENSKNSAQTFGF